GATEVEAHNHLRDAQPGLGLQSPQRFRVAFVTSLGELGYAVEQRHLSRVAVFALRHDSPAVPWQQLAFCQRRQVAHHIAAYEPQPTHIQDAEALRIGAPASATLPRVAGDDELIAR